MKQSILDRIRDSYQTMTTPRKRIADLILSEPAKCVFLSIREMAKQSNTTDVTVQNFCKGLGCDSFQEMKRELREYVMKWVSSPERLSVITTSTSSAASLFESIERGTKEAIEASFKRNREDKYLKAASLIAEKKHIFAIGHSASRIPAEYLRYRFLSMGVEINILALEDIHLSMQRIASVDNYDDILVISFAYPPYGSSTIAATKLLKNKNAGVISFTDAAASPLSELSDICFLCPPIKTLGSLTNSYFQVMSAVETLSIFYQFIRTSGNESSKLDKEYSELLKSLIEYKSRI